MDTSHHLSSDAKEASIFLLLSRDTLEFLYNVVELAGQVYPVIVRWLCGCCAFLSITLFSSSVQPPKQLGWETSRELHVHCFELFQWYAVYSKLSCSWHSASTISQIKYTCHVVSFSIIANICMGMVKRHCITINLHCANTNEHKPWKEKIKR